MPALSEAFLAIFDHPGPVVAAVNGHAIAGGCVIAAACDLRVMSEGKIGLAELSVGVPFPTSALEILRHAAGPAASQLVLTVYAFSKRQLRRPAREQIAARTGEDDKTVLASWSSQRTMDAIARYLDALERRPRPAR